MINNILDFITDAKKVFGVTGEGNIYYMNSEGTRNTWEKACLLCDFVYKIDDKIVLRTCIAKNGLSRIYYYPDDSKIPEKFLERKLYNTMEMRDVYSYMFNVSDRQGFYNENIEKFLI